MKKHSSGFTLLEIILGLAIISVLGFVGWSWYKADQHKKAVLAINSFEGCVAAGYPVAESSPEQCFTPDGRAFTKKVEEQKKTSEYTEYTSRKGETILVKTPTADTEITSPLKVTGQVKGTWSFEATFGVTILDENRQKVADGYATLQGDWMTEQYVDFEGTIEFTKPASGKGFVVLEKSNPSGLAENEDSVEIPVRF